MPEFWSFIGPGETDIVSPVNRAGRGWLGADEGQAYDGRYG